MELQRETSRRVYDVQLDTRGPHRARHVCRSANLIFARRRLPIRQFDCTIYMESSIRGAAYSHVRDSKDKVID